MFVKICGHHKRVNLNDDGFYFNRYYWNYDDWYEAEQPDKSSDFELYRDGQIRLRLDPIILLSEKDVFNNDFISKMDKVLK